MIDLLSEKLIHHKLLFLLVNFVRKLHQFFISKLFLEVLKMLFLKSLSLVHLASLPGTVFACKESCIIH